MGIFDSTILKLLFLKTGFYLLCFVILKIIF
ncbi:membrane protein [Helicobacter pylori]|nr:membrane protein [Helicobacter pylori]